MPRPIHRPTGNSSAPVGDGSPLLVVEVELRPELEALLSDIDDGVETESETDDVLPLLAPESGAEDGGVSETEVDEATVDDVDSVDVNVVRGTKSVPHCAGRQVLAMHAVNGWLATHLSMRAHCANNPAHSQPKDHGSLGCLPHSSRMRPMRLGFGIHASYRDSLTRAHVNVVVVDDCECVDVRKNNSSCNNTVILSCLIFRFRKFRPNTALLSSAPPPTRKKIFLFLFSFGNVLCFSFLQKEHRQRRHQ
jgi:hypothetical protein